jgi:hypothetical protein
VNSCIAAASANAAIAASGALLAPEPNTEATVTFALGDPQATTEKMFEVLAAHQLLTPQGWLKPGIRLVSVGDHFDFGSFSGRLVAQQAGLQNLAWLAAHSPEQVVLLLGNHDLARVGELISFDDVSFERAATEAHAIYQHRHQHTQAEWRALERDFVERWPALPTVEVAARDYSGYHSTQRDLVIRLLVEGRFLLAWGAKAALVTHAGVTGPLLERLGMGAAEMTDAALVATRLNQRLKDVLQNWSADTELVIPDLHVPGSGKRGEGFGTLFHRPAHPARIAAAETEEEQLRRFDPRTLPPGLSQVVGHVRDPKCRLLLGAWTADAAGPEGPVRSLLATRTSARYAWGVQDAEEDVARMIFVDGGLNTAPSTGYELLELDTLTPRRAQLRTA